MLSWKYSMLTYLAPVFGGDEVPTIQYFDSNSTRIRRHAGPSIYNCSPADLLTPAARRKFRGEIGWCEYEDGEGGEYASLDVPLLHEDDSPEYDIKTCFLNPAPMRMFVALIRGPKAATAMLKSTEDSEETSVRAQTDNMEHIHRILHTEPGAIAASSTIWGKSADECLKPRGDHTNIDYAQLFEEYLDILTTGLRKKNPSILHVFSEWDRIVFPNADCHYFDTQKTRRRRKSDGYNRAMEAMQEEEAARRDETGGGEGGEDEGDDAGNDSTPDSAPFHASNDGSPITLYQRAHHDTTYRRDAACRLCPIPPLLSRSRPVPAPRDASVWCCVATRSARINPYLKPLSVDRHPLSTAPPPPPYRFANPRRV
ncbi:hypothetical protein DFH09DRAFT_1451093 [Mycena vulgaris]|nr:hypothetical protein DFH09DRAFT_1451093 [Mycena vulgaris]